MGKYRNKRKERIKKNADNPFTAMTGIPVTRLSGKGAIPPSHTSPCWIVGTKNYKFIPARKVSYAIAKRWLPMYIAVDATRMKDLRVKQSCKIDQCVNPEHLIGKEKTIDPADRWHR